MNQESISQLGEAALGWGPLVGLMEIKPEVYFCLGLCVLSSCGCTGVISAHQGLPWWSSGSDFVLPLQGAWVRPLVRELRPHMPRSVAKKKKKKCTP